MWFKNRAAWKNLQELVRIWSKTLCKRFSTPLPASIYDFIHIMAWFASGYEKGFVRSTDTTLLQIVVPGIQ